MGAYTKYRIFSLRQKKEIEPHRTEASRSGNHWTDFWYLLPGKYFIAWRDISNTGKHYCGYGLLIVGSPFIQLKNGEVKLFKEVKREDDKYIGDGQSFDWKEVEAYSPHQYGVAKWVGDIPDFGKDALCECILPRHFAE